MANRSSRTGQLLLSQGLAAHALATAHAARLTARLPAGLVDGVAADVSALGGLVPDALTAQQQRKGATAVVTTSANEVAALVSAIRLSIVHAGLDAGARKAWGVGQRVDARVVKSVRSAASLIARRAATAPDEARAAGILAGDLAELAAGASALGGHDSEQEGAKVTAKQATAARNAAERRLGESINRIAAAGQLEFKAEPATVAEFAALLVVSGTRSKKKPAPAKPATT